VRESCSGVVQGIEPLDCERMVRIKAKDGSGDVVGRPERMTKNGTLRALLTNGGKSFPR